MAEVDSSTGGHLSPAGTPAPDEDAALDALFQTAFAAITGLPGALVRPRWQPGNPKQPEPHVDWCALAVTSSEPDAGPAIQHISVAQGTDSYARHEQIEVLTSFYGPRSKTFSGRLRDGLAMPQNMEPLRTKEIGLVECGTARAFPEFVNQQWIRRVDMLVRFSRKVSRIYSVRNVAAADVHLFDATNVDELITVPPAQ
jgi:hypothetical protein